MMKHPKLFFLSLLIIAFACENKNSTDEKNTVETSPQIKKQEILATSQGCHPDSTGCTWIRITYTEFGDEKHKAVDGFIQSKITETASGFVDESFTGTTPAEAARAFIDNFESFKKEFPDYEFGWFLSIDADVIYEKNPIATVRIEMESYTGGAHSNAATQYFVLNEKTGNPLSINEIISDTVAFKKQIDSAFRKENGISADQSLFDANLDIENFSDVPCDNVGITDSVVIVHFNSYEIAPYAAGPTTVRLPKETLKGILKVK